MAEPIVNQKGPFAVQIEAGKQYAWCQCGRSRSQPFCDGSHAGTGLTPVSFTAEQSGTVYLCGCKHTGNAPYCDGTHATF